MSEKKHESAEKTRPFFRITALHLELRIPSRNDVNPDLANALDLYDSEDPSRCISSLVDLVESQERNASANKVLLYLLFNGGRFEDFVRYGAEFILGDHSDPNSIALYGIALSLSLSLVVGDLKRLLTHSFEL